MKKFALSMVGIFAFGMLAGLLQADTAPAVAAPVAIASVSQSAAVAVSAPDVHYFEPTQADYDAHSTAIKAQQAAYKTAAAAKNWEEAQANALFHFTKAWLYFNEGMNVKRAYGSSDEVTKITVVLNLFSRAEAELKMNTHHRDSAKECARLLKKNRKWAEERLASLTSK